jgi:phospholipid/cholesterol/gamma-HCH transport system ATP-binding protein
MKTALKVADRIVMFYSLDRLKPGENQILFDGTPQQIRRCQDPRVLQFVEGEAHERLIEINQN